VMVLVTLRHLEDNAYTDRLSASRSSRPDLLPIADTDARPDRSAEELVAGTVSR